LSFFLVPIPELQHAFLFSKCCEPGSVLQFFILSLFSPFKLVIESIKEFGGASQNVCWIFYHFIVDGFCYHIFLVTHAPIYLVVFLFMFVCCYISCNFGLFSFIHVVLFCARHIDYTTHCTLRCHTWFELMHY
jgi:hypothetical protein